MLLVAAGLAPGLAACDEDPDPGRVSESPSAVSAEDSRAALGSARDAVLAAHDEVTRIVVRRTGGVADPADVSGRFDGCETSGVDEYASFRYELRSRVDVGSSSVAPPFLEQLLPDLAESGFAPGEVGPLGSSPTVRTVLAARDDLDASVVENPDLSVLVLTVSGPCLPTRPEDTDYWLQER